MELQASFNTLDFIVLGVILVSGLLAILTGFVREVYSLFNWIASYFVAVHYYYPFEPFVKRYISNSSTVADVSIFITFCACFILLALVGMVVTRFVQGPGLTAIDRSLGFVFGVVRGVLMVCLVYLVAAALLWPDIDKAPPEASIDQQAVTAEAPKAEENKVTVGAPAWLMKARTRPLLVRGARMLKEFVPEKVFEKTAQKYIEKGKNKAKEEIDEQMHSPPDNSN